MTELQTLLDKVVTADSDQTRNISLLGEQLHTNRLSEVLAAGEIEAGGDERVVREVVRALVSVPDRTINMLGVSQSELEDWLYPPQYCRLVLRNLARCLRSCSSHPTTTTTTSTGLCSQLYHCLASTYPDQVLACQPWWTYLVSCPEESRALLGQSGLDWRTRARAVLATLKFSSNPRTVRLLFSDSLTESQVVELVLVRGEKWLGPEQVWCLVSYLGQSSQSSQSSGQDLQGWLVRLLTVWSDETEVDQGDLHYLSLLSWTLCSLLGCLSPAAVVEVRDKLRLRLTSGLTHWLEADPTKRQLGQCVASVILTALGGPAPDWEIEDTQCLQLMTSLTQRDRQAKEVHYEVELERWEDWPARPEERAEEKKVTATTSSPARVLDSDDSEAEDSDDDLPAYDLSDDKPWEKDSKPLLYVRDVIAELSDPDSRQQEECLQKIVEFSQSRLRHEDPEVLTELLSLTVHLQNRLGSPDWNSCRRSALTSLTLCSPAVSAPSLTKVSVSSHLSDNVRLKYFQRIFEREVTLDTKFAVLESLVEAGTRLRAENSAQLAGFLSLSVSGLCGGAGWDRVRVRGLESSLLTQSLLTTVSLARLGENCPGWLNLLQLSTELLLSAAAGQNKRPVEAAVLHGLGVVATLVPPHLLNNTNLAQMLARGAQWAAGLTGDLQQSAEATVNIINYKHQESLRLQVERDLVQATEIKMTIDKHQVKLK